MSYDDIIFLVTRFSEVFDQAPSETRLAFPLTIEDHRGLYTAQSQREAAYVLFSSLVGNHVGYWDKPQELVELLGELCAVTQIIDYGIGPARFCGLPLDDPNADGVTASQRGLWYVMARYCNLLSTLPGTVFKRLQSPKSIDDLIEHYIVAQ